MSTDPDLQVRRRGLKLLLLAMFVFTVASPLVGPKLFPDEFARMTTRGKLVFFIGTPSTFALLFILNLIRYRRLGKRQSK